MYYHKFCTILFFILNFSYVCFSKVPTCNASEQASSSTLSSSSSSLLQKTSTFIDIQSFSAYNFLCSRSAFIKKKVIKKDCAIKNLLNILDDTKRLFESIINDFNSKELKLKYKIKYEFVRVYSSLNLSEKTTIRDIRKFKRKIKKFNNYIVTYNLKQQQKLFYFRNNNISLLNKIIQLNSRLVNWFLRDEFLEATFWDKCFDKCLCQPWEWICSHKTAVITASIVTATAIGCYYLYPKYKKHTLRNRNKTYKVKQFKALQQSGDTCAYHALNNIRCFIQGKSDEEIEQLLSDRNAFNTNYTKWTKITKNSGAIDGFDLINLIKNQNSGISNQNLLTIPYTNLTQQNNLLSELSHLYDVTVMPTILENFRNGQPISTLINTGSSVTNNGEYVDTSKTVAHWYAAQFIPDIQVPNGIRIRVADSAGDLNRTNHEAINGIANNLKKLIN